MSVTESQDFLTADDLDSCCIEKILRNKFRDPLISSESEDDQPKSKINWDEVFTPKKNVSNTYSQLIWEDKFLPYKITIWSGILKN